MLVVLHHLERIMKSDLSLQYRNYSIKETSRITGMCRAYLYKEIKAVTHPL